jgi:hypothetical protein
LTGGHYTATIKQDTKWITYDDMNAFEIDESNLNTSGAYILVYKFKGHNVDTNYFNLMRNILDSQDNEFNINEPVRTPYGRGYIEDITSYEGRKHIKVKFRFGSASLK